jgi:UDP-N-acetylglucosamine--N-acetylmuramyl-(pentapeptide) pyrophosphoryl-undecaprenol N-acetylglucosamine transferase
MMIFKRKGEHRQAALNVVIAGGVTGGHLFPGIAIAQAFMEKDPENNILFISSGNAFEQSVLSRAGFALKAIPVTGIKGKGLKNQIGTILCLPKSIWHALYQLKRFAPDLVIGMGCYSAGPVAVAALLMGIRLVLHEQNILPGITNRILSPFADRIYLSFENKNTGFNPNKIRYSGNPVRLEFTQPEDRKTGLPENEPGRKKPFTVFVVGGSQGAHSINAAVMEASAGIKHKKDYFFIHQTGTADEREVSLAYERHGIKAEVAPFFDHMVPRYREANLIICRSGATTVAEISALGKAAIFIPFPHAADNHQTLNARALADAGAAEMILEAYLSGQLLARRVEHYAENPQALSRMENIARKYGRPEAAKFIVNDCYSALAG